MDVDVDRVTVAAVPVGGQLLARAVDPLAATTQPAAPRWPRAIATGRRPRLDSSTMPAGAWPVGVGVSVPGTVRAAEGIVEAAPNLGWWGVRFAAMLASAAAGRAAGVARQRRRPRRAGRAPARRRARLRRRRLPDGTVGVGAGIIIGGRPLHGVGGLAGEIGHNVLDPAGPPCHCGGRGCVETFLGEDALLHLAGRPGPPDARPSPRCLAAARPGDPAPLRASSQVARSLGQVLANLVNLLNPQVIVLGGVLAGVLEVAGREVTAELDRQAMGAARRMVEVRSSGLGGDSSLLGAAEIAVRLLLADPSAAAFGPGGDGPAAIAQH